MNESNKPNTASSKNNMQYWINTKLVTYLSFSNERQLCVYFGGSVLVVSGENSDMDKLREDIMNQSREPDPWIDLHLSDYAFQMYSIPLPDTVTPKLEDG